MTEDVSQKYTKKSNEFGQLARAFQTIIDNFKELCKEGRSNHQSKWHHHQNN